MALRRPLSHTPSTDIPLWGAYLAPDRVHVIFTMLLSMGSRRAALSFLPSLPFRCVFSLLASAFLSVKYPSSRTHLRWPLPDHDEGRKPSNHPPRVHVGDACRQPPETSSWGHCRASVEAHRLDLVCRETNRDRASSCGYLTGDPSQPITADPG